MMMGVWGTFRRLCHQMGVAATGDVEAAASLLEWNVVLAAFSHNTITSFSAATTLSDKSGIPSLLRYPLARSRNSSNSSNPRSLEEISPCSSLNQQHPFHRHI